MPPNYLCKRFLHPLPPYLVCKPAIQLEGAKIRRRKGGMLTRKREGARDFLSPGHLVTWSPGHPVTWSPCHPVTLSPCRLFTIASQQRQNTKTQRRKDAKAFCHLVTWSPGHLVTWSPCHLVTISHIQASCKKHKETKTRRDEDVGFLRDFAASREQASSAVPQFRSSLSVGLYYILYVL
jgi:hypothetical protein